MSDEITDDQEVSVPGAEPELADRPWAGPPAGADIEGAGWVVDATGAATLVSRLDEAAREQDVADNGQHVADNGESPAPAATGTSLAAATAESDRARTNGSKPAKTKSSKDKSGKGKSSKDKSGKSKSERLGVVGDAPSRPYAGPAPGEVAPVTDDAKKRVRVRQLVGANMVAVALGVVAVALAVALVLTMLQVSHRNAVINNQKALDGARTSALAAASTYSVELAGYDYRHLAEDFGVVLAHSTPSFRSSFTQSSDALKATLVKYHASAHATIVAAGLVKATTTSAVALVFLDQTVTNSTQKQPTTDRSQVEITLVLSGRTWLIDQVALL
jgi:Mce-associated membrane protein